MSQQPTMEEHDPIMDCEKRVYAVTRNMSLEQLEAVVVVLHIITQNIHQYDLNNKTFVKTLERIFDKTAEECYIQKEGMASAAISERARLGHI